MDFHIQCMRRIVNADKHNALRALLAPHARALIFHLISIADGSAAAGPVSLKTSELAAAWCNYLESHARRIYGLVSNATLQAAATLAKKIRAGKWKLEALGVI
jgi:hypothetical protein